jgi:hypothetical protein
VRPHALFHSPAASLEPFINDGAPFRAAGPFATTDVATTSHDGTNVPTIGGMFVGPAYLAVYSANSSSSEFVTVYETAFGTELAIERGQHDRAQRHQ